MCGGGVYVYTYTALAARGHALGNAGGGERCGVCSVQVGCGMSRRVGRLGAARGLGVAQWVGAVRCSGRGGAARRRRAAFSGVVPCRSGVRSHGT